MKQTLKITFLSLLVLLCFVFPMSAGAVGIDQNILYENSTDAEVYTATVEKHRYGTVYMPYIHTNDSAKPYSLIDGIHYSTNHSRDSVSTYTIAANFDTTISINYGVSSERSFDEFKIRHNETQLICISGLDSGKMTINLAQGDVLLFIYEKDDSESDGDDRGWFEITSEDNYVNEELITPNCRGEVRCLDCGEILSEQLPHNVIAIPVITPTCTTEGKTAGQACSECGFVTVMQNAIPMASHSFVNGICTICESDTYSEGITFKLDEEGTSYIVTGIGTFTGENVVIPQIYNRLPVKKIGALAFANCSKIKNVTIPASITEIEDSVFYSCTGLKGVYISDLNAWCDISFDFESEWDEGLWVESYSNPLKYAHNLYLNGKQVTDIVLSDAPSAFAFYGCSLNSVTFTRQVGLNTGVFCSSSLKELSIPGGPSYLQPYALNGCSNINGAFYLPASVTEVGDWNFWGPSIKVMYLEGSKIPSRCDDLDYGNTGPFYGSGSNVVYNCQLVQVDGNDYIIKDGEAWFIRCSQTRSGSVEVLPQVTYGGQKYDVTKIGDYAFYHCDKITGITIPASITSIGRESFTGTSGLRRVDISDLASWCNIAFTYVSSNPLYYNCDMYLNGELVTNVIIPDSVTCIGNYAFYGYDKLTNITMGSSIINVGYEAFSYCRSLQTIRFLSDAPNIKQDAFDNITATVEYPVNNDSWTDAILQDYGGTITWVPYTTGHIHEYDDEHKCECGAIGGTCGDNLTWVLSEDGTLTISGVAEMDDYDWSNCAPWYNYNTTISKVVVEDGITSIGNSAFVKCSNMSSITLPEGIAVIGDYAFQQCSSLVNINIPKSVRSIGENAFWLCSNLISIAIPDGITQISHQAFASCGALTEVVLPNSIITIDSGAFMNCSSLCNITIPKGVTSIGNAAFYECQTLRNMILPEGVITIGDSAFEKCYNLNSLSLPEGLMSIGENAFSWCQGLLSIVLPESVTNIGDWAFYTCSNLTSVNVPKGITEIGKSVFNRCLRLATIAIPENVTAIGDYAFNLSGLETIVFAGNAPSFTENALAGVMSEVHYPADNATWTDNVKQQYGGTITWVPYGTEHTISINNSIANGTVIADRTTAQEGDIVTLTVTPDPYFVVDRVTYQYEDEPNYLSANDDGTYSFTMPSEDVTVSAEFRYATHVSGIPINAENAHDVLGDGTVSYDLVTNTMRLDGAVIEGSDINGTTVIYGIHSMHGLNIVLGEKNSIIQNCHEGIEVFGDLSISGGSLIIQNASGVGIWVQRDNLTINDSTITVNMTQNGGHAICASRLGSTITINSGKLMLHGGEISGTGRYGLAAFNLIFGNDVHIVASGGSGAVYVVPKLADGATGKSRTDADAEFASGIVYNNEQYFEFIGSGYSETEDDPPEDTVQEYPPELKWFFEKLEEPDSTLWATGYYAKIMEQYGASKQN